MSRMAMMLTRFVLILLMLGTSGCYATYIQARSPANPLDQIAQRAQKEWKVERIDTNTLRLRDFWPINSVVALGYSRSHANLVYDPAESVLNIQYYFKSNSVGTLFLPIYLDSESGFIGVMFLKPTMIEQIDDIVQWGKFTPGSIISRRDGKRSEPFPQKSSSSPPTAN